MRLIDLQIETTTEKASGPVLASTLERPSLMGKNLNESPPKLDPIVKQTCPKIPSASFAGSQASVCYELTQIYLSNTTDEIAS